jgi:hypothetical protein
MLLASHWGDQQETLIAKIALLLAPLVAVLLEPTPTVPPELHDTVDFAVPEAPT